MHFSTWEKIVFDGHMKIVKNMTNLNTLVFSHLFFMRVCKLFSFIKREDLFPLKAFSCFLRGMSVETFNPSGQRFMVRGNLKT